MKGLVKNLFFLSLILLILNSLPLENRLEEGVSTNFAEIPDQHINKKNLSFTNIDDGLVTYLPLDEGVGSVAYDNSPNANNAVVSGASWSNGISGSALEFDGFPDYAIIEPPLPLDSQQITVCLWVQYGDVPLDDFSYNIISQDSGDNRVFQLSTFYQRIVWHRLEEGRDLLSNNQITVGSWYFVVAGYNGSHHYLFVDGELQDSVSGSFNPNGQTAVDIGRLNWGAEEWRDRMSFEGKLDEIRIYNRSLSADEIDFLYQQQKRTPHEPIIINGNADFVAQASLESWTGDGSPLNSYIIENYFISTTTFTGIKISNTDVHFIIRNVAVTGTGIPGSGFSLNNVENGQLINNSAYDNTDSGFYLTHSSNNVLSNNFAFNNAIDGIFLEGNSNNNSLINNKVIDHGRYGFWIKQSIKNTLINNTSQNSNDYGFYFLESNNVVSTNNSANSNIIGFYVEGSDMITFTHNIVMNNYNSGFFFGSSNNNTLQNNTINNNGYGVDLEGSSNNLLSNNIVSNNQDYGFFLHNSERPQGSSSNIIQYNQIENNSLGINTDNSCHNNQFIYNNFINNNDGESQAFDEGGIDSIFSNNYWNDWTMPDLDQDGIVDEPYDIPAHNQDSFPQVNKQSYFFRDTDKDGIPDDWEVQNNLDPTVNDAQEDMDGDGMNNYWEYLMGLNPADSSDALSDQDGDGLSNYQEFTIGTSAILFDTDGDKLDDGYEFTIGLNPLVFDSHLDPDGDWVTNLEEYYAGTDPFNLFSFPILSINVVYTVYFQY